MYFYGVKIFLRNLAQLSLFWIGYFLFSKALFLLYHWDKTTDAGWESWGIFFHGLRMDLAMLSYLMTVPLLLSLLGAYFLRSFFNKVLNGFQYALIVFIGLLNVIDTNIYTEWGCRINSRAIDLLVHSPSEALASSASSPLFASFLFFLCNVGATIWTYRKWVSVDMTEQRPHPAVFLPVWILLVGCDIIGTRGGIQLAPINQSSAYFSNQPYLNHASLNTFWNLLNSISENKFDTKNHYTYFSEQEATSICQEAYPANNDSTEKILTTDRPNIVFIILESFSADLIHPLGGDRNTTPFLNEFCKEGLLFTRAYSSGDRTDKGLVALFSGFPAQATRSIIQQPDKFEKLPAWSLDLQHAGYRTSFCYGGELEFSNFRSYLKNKGFSTLIAKEAFEAKDMNSKWGAHDAVVLQKQLDFLRTEQQPFLSALLTLSTHEPFEVPVPDAFSTQDLPGKMRNTAHYTDASLRAYFEQAKKEAWYPNTLFILIADHGHRLPKEYANAYDLGKYHIPLLLTGPALKKEYQGKTLNQAFSQTDLAATLLTQLQLPSTSFTWSKNYFAAKTEHSAFYNFDNGFGWVTDSGCLSFDNVSRQITSCDSSLTTLQKNTMERLGKAEMQTVFQQYLAF